MLRDADEALAVIRVIGDLIVGAALKTAGKKTSAFDKELEDVVALVAGALDEKLTPEERTGRIEALKRKAASMLEAGAKEGLAGRKPFHWAIEFPEIFHPDLTPEHRGFHAIVGNPPFMGGQKITGALGTDYRDYLVQHLAHGQRGSADICAYFFLRAHHLLQQGGMFGLIATNTIAQGDTREVGLEQLLKGDCVVPRAVPSRKETVPPSWK